MINYKNIDVMTELSPQLKRNEEVNFDSKYPY